MNSCSDLRADLIAGYCRATREGRGPPGSGVVGGTLAETLIWQLCTSSASAFRMPRKNEITNTRIIKMRSLVFINYNFSTGSYGIVVIVAPHIDMRRRTDNAAGGALAPPQRLPGRPRPQRFNDIEAAPIAQFAALSTSRPAALL